jgi:endonuclease-3 related protein
MFQVLTSPPEKSLHRFYAAAREHFGYAETWWPGSPLELTLTAVLVQQCDWSKAWAAVGKLRDAGLVDLESLSRAEAEEVQACIHSVNFAPTKSIRLVRLSQALLSLGFCSIEALLESEPTDRVRDRLIELPGIGPETADCVLLFASDQHETFVVDAYARRLFRRMGLFPTLDQNFWTGSYEKLQRFFLEHITGFPALYDAFEFAPGVPFLVALLRDFHAQIVEIGKHHCLKTRPRCESPGKGGWKDYYFCREHCENNTCSCCPLSSVCASAQLGLADRATARRA